MHFFYVFYLQFIPFILDRYYIRYEFLITDSAIEFIDEFIFTRISRGNELCDQSNLGGEKFRGFSCDYCTSFEVAHKARIRSTSGLVSRKERPQIAIAVVGMITTGDHEFDAIWTAQRTVRGAPDRVLIVRKEVRLIVTPEKIIYMTNTAAGQTATFTSPKSVFYCKDDVTYSYRSWTRFSGLLKVRFYKQCLILRYKHKDTEMLTWQSFKIG